jgi:predicted esterase
VTAPIDSAGSPAREISVERGVPYGHGQKLDIYTPRHAGSSSVVLLWHGAGADERDVLEPVAGAAAELGVTVIVPDWQSGTPDGGRAQLLGSVSFTRQRCAAGHGGSPGDRGIVLAGWSRGGKAAAGLAVNQEAAGGWRPAAVVCLGSGFRSPAPTTGTSPLQDLARTAAAPVPFWLVHGTKDRVVDPGRSREFAVLLAERGWPARLEEPPTDHAGVIMAEYDPRIRRARPAASLDAIEAGQFTARILRAAASGRQPTVDL